MGSRHLWCLRSLLTVGRRRRTRSGACGSRSRLHQQATALDIVASHKQLPKDLLLGADSRGVANRLGCIVLPAEPPLAVQGAVSTADLVWVEATRESQWAAQSDQRPIQLFNNELV